MAVAIGLAFLAGVITAVSPCVLPVLPIVFSGGATGSTRRPYAIIAGLATCFLVSILFASWVLKQLHLPQDRFVSLGEVPSLRNQRPDPPVRLEVRRIHPGELVPDLQVAHFVESKEIGRAHV